MHMRQSRPYPGLGLKHVSGKSTLTPLYCSGVGRLPGCPGHPGLVLGGMVFWFWTGFLVLGGCLDILGHGLGTRPAPPRIQLLSLLHGVCRYGQFTRFGHIPGGGGALLWEGVPISYEAKPSRCFSPSHTGHPIQGCATSLRSSYTGLYPQRFTV